MISNTIIRLKTIFFDISKAHYATASKLTLRVQTVEAAAASFRQEMLPKNIESRS
jgi:hypothetical protein